MRYLQLKRCVFALLVALAVSTVSANRAAGANHVRDLNSVSKSAPISEIEQKVLLPSLASSDRVYFPDDGGMVQIGFGDPALAGVDPATANFVELVGPEKWGLVKTKIDVKGRRILTKVEAGRVYALVGASSFDLVREQQLRLCNPRIESRSPRELIDPICTQILCTADAMSGIDRALDMIGEDGLRAMPAATQAGNICERCLGGRGPMSGELIECGIKTPGGASPFKPGTVEPFKPIPWWPSWPVWKIGKQANACSPGRYKVGQTSYDFPGGFPLPNPYGDSDVRAEVRYPAKAYGANVDPEIGSFPIVVFLHGNHCICSTSCTSHSCSPSNRIPNHRGYDYILDVLASRGYIAVSIDGFSVTAINQTFGPLTDYEARGQLILEHLRRWQNWNQNGGSLLSGKFMNRVNMSKIGLVGHSRGGEGVVAADVLNVVQSEGFSIKAVAAIAPTAQDGLVDWVPLSPYLVILSNNDGDVVFLSGQKTYDRAFSAIAPKAKEKTAFWIFGTNHNFFNTTWTPGSGDPFASDDGQGDGRLQPAAQRRVGCQIITNFMDKELKGSALAGEAIRGERPMTGLGAVEIHVQHGRNPVLWVDDFDHGNGKLVNSLGGAVTTSGFSHFEIESFVQGVFASSFRGDTNGLVLSWNGNASYETALPITSRDVRRYRSLAFRLGRIRDSSTLPPVEQPWHMSVTLIDQNGNEANHRFSVTQVATTPYPAKGAASPTILTTVRLPLVDYRKDNARFNFAGVAKIRFTFDGSSKLAIDDIVFDDRGRIPWMSIILAQP